MPGDQGSGTRVLGQWRMAVNGVNISQFSSEVFQIDTDTIRINDGTVGVPTIIWINDTDTGLFRPADDALGISVNGTERFRVSNNRIAITGTIARC